MSNTFKPRVARARIVTSFYDDGGIQSTEVMKIVMSLGAFNKLGAGKYESRPNADRNDIMRTIMNVMEYVEKHTFDINTLDIVFDGFFAK